MSFEMACGSCGQPCRVPDHAVGQCGKCPGCGAAIAIPVETPPLMPPDPGAKPSLDIVLVNNVPASKVVPASEVVPATAVVPLSTAERSGPSPAPARNQPAPAPARNQPTPAEVHSTPILAAATPRPATTREPSTPAQPRHAAPRGQQQSGPIIAQEPVTVTDKVAARGGSPVMAWIVAGVVFLIGGAAVLIVVLYSVLHVNPSPSSVKRKFAPDATALSQLGPSVTGAGYSFQLPRGFAPTSPPSAANDLEGTETAAWQAAPNSIHSGSTFKLWVIPTTVDIEQELHRNFDLSSRIGIPAQLTNASGHYRMGNGSTDFVTVRGLFNVINRDTLLYGVVYLIADEGKTLVVVGEARGDEAKNMQALLDTAVRTIDRAS